MTEAAAHSPDAAAAPSGSGTSLGATEHLSSCRNCGYDFASLPNERPNFCPRCGQDTHAHAPSFWEFVHEFITHYVALEGKLWKTLALLFFVPGQLTKHYSAGRKLTYVAPLRLYITASFLFFLVVKVAGFGNIVTTNSTTSREAPALAQTNQAAPTSADGAVGEHPPPARAGGVTIGSSRDAIQSGTRPAADVLSSPVQTNFQCKPDETTCLWLQRHVEAKWQGKTSADVMTALKAGVVSNLPYAMFFMLPVFAGFTYWLYWRRKLYFGEHMVYAMHVHAFAFFTLLAKATLPHVAGDVVVALSLLYYFVAMQRFFGGRWWATCLRFAFVGIFYPVVLVALTGAIIIFSVVI